MAFAARTHPARAGYHPLLRARHCGARAAACFGEEHRAHVPVSGQIEQFVRFPARSAVLTGVIPAPKPKRSRFLNHNRSAQAARAGGERSRKDGMALLWWLVCRIWSTLEVYLLPRAAAGAYSVLHSRPLSRARRTWVMLDQASNATSCSSRRANCAAGRSWTVQPFLRVTDISHLARGGEGGGGVALLATAGPAMIIHHDSGRCVRPCGGSAHHLTAGMTALGNRFEQIKYLAWLFPASIASGMTATGTCTKVCTASVYRWAHAYEKPVRPASSALRGSVALPTDELGE
ncbi:hypothetical protein T492DRAFT_1124644 [Pavlovales sp. CCMP2436]|nr:hypothetical protein T492DRAFT_1124644 [Pavlovales sp. CCMP2436]